MHKKICTSCKGKSYSSYNGDWICPYCGADLNAVKPESARSDNNEESIKDKILYPLPRLELSRITAPR